MPTVEQMASSLALNYAAVSREIEGFIRRSVEEAGRRGVVVGISGGVDSATTATLATRALGRERVMALVLPSSSTRREDTEDALELASRLGVRTEVLEISGVVRQVLSLYRGDVELSRVAAGNVSPRVRMTILYLYANNLDLLVAGTGNRSELLVGYFTKYGDGGVDILPIGDLYKTQVRGLGSWLGLPRKIVEKVPTAGLWAGQTDESELGITYTELDSALHALVDLGLSVEEASRKTGIPASTLERIDSMVKRSSHKRATPPIPRVRDLVS